MDGSTLTFNKKLSNGENNISLIRFTDRPYRFDKHFVGEEAEIYLNKLFTENPEGFNSFSKDPPNGVLVINKDNINSVKSRQEAFEIKMRTVSNGKISMILNLLENQNNIEPFTSQPINLFIDVIPKVYYVGRTCMVPGNHNIGTILNSRNNVNLYVCFITKDTGNSNKTSLKTFTVSANHDPKGPKFRNGKV